MDIDILMGPKGNLLWIPKEDCTSVIHMTKTE